MWTKIFSKLINENVYKTLMKIEKSNLMVLEIPNISIKKKKIQ